MPRGDENREARAQSSVWRMFKTIAGNVLELSGSTLQIAAEITTFVAGLGFFIVPPLKKIYSELEGKPIGYSLSGEGQLCADTLDQPPNTLCKQFDEPITHSNIPFNFPYPDQLFTTSAVLLALGCSGLVTAYALKKGGESLHESKVDMPPSEEQVAIAKTRVKLFFLLSMVLFLCSRIGAIYASTTISLAKTLEHLPNVLSSFSFSSSNEVVYNPPESSIIPFPFSKVRAVIALITRVDFSQLRDGARLGSEELNEYDYYIALWIAALACILGYLALKTNQQYTHYADVLLRHKYSEELSALQPTQSSRHPQPPQNAQGPQYPQLPQYPHYPQRPQSLQLAQYSQYLQRPQYYGQSQVTEFTETTEVTQAPQYYHYHHRSHRHHQRHQQDGEVLRIMSAYHAHGWFQQPRLPLDDYYDEPYIVELRDVETRQMEV